LLSQYGMLWELGKLPLRIFLILLTYLNQPSAHENKEQGLPNLEAAFAAPSPKLDAPYE
jgi:hypothetical protein